MSIEIRIRDIRKNFNLTQTQFAEELGVTRNVISMYELGHVVPPRLFLDHLCTKYGVNKTWLETGDGEMFKTPSIDEEIAEFVGTALNGNSDPFKRRVLLALSRMDESGWQKAKEFLLMLKEEEEREMILDIKEKGTE